MTRNLGAAVLAVGVATGLVYALRPVAPTLSLGVVYTPAVIVVSLFASIPWTIATAFASMLVFNLLFLPPVGTLTLADGRNWTALAVYVGCGILAGELAARARRRAEEAERRERETAVLADVAAELLYGASAPAEIEQRVRAELGVPAGHLRTALDALVATAAERERLEGAARESEVLRRSDATKTAILRSVSHDFRTPLATMRAAVDGLRGGATEPARDELLASLHVELARLTRLVVNLLDLSRLQAGAALPRRELWSADELVAQTLEAVDDPRVEVELSPDLPPVEVDATQLQRVLSNLLENALRFSPPGAPVVLRVGVEGEELVVEVADRGAGIAADEAPALLEPFVRGAGSTGGAGLGLAIAQGFAAANDARIELLPRPGGGTVARVSMRAAEPLPA